MTQPISEFSAPAADGSGAAAALGLAPSDLAAAQEAGLPLPLPVQVGSSGVSFLFVPLATRAAVDRAELDFAKLSAFYADAGIGPAKGCFVFSLEQPSVADSDAGADADASGGDGMVVAYSRMFAPNLGIQEDPATGSASGPLGCYLVRHGAVVGAAAANNILNLQGVKMGRRSCIHISIGLGDEMADDGDGVNATITSVRVGGKSVVVGEGSVILPSSSSS